MGLKFLESYFSRRSLMRGLVTIPLIGIAAKSAQAAKLSKSAVAYQDTPKDAHRCDTCKLFQAPHSCAEVSGTISPNGWCQIWVAKA